MTRVLLHTGKGGVGKTTLAAAVAARVARDGARTLLTSTDPAHSLADVLDVPLGDDPRPVAPRLLAQQLDAQARLEAGWGDLREWLVGLLSRGGLGQVEAEELVLLPGIDELFALVDLGHAVGSGEHDVVVVDCAPTAETLRLLALPTAMSFWHDRVLRPGPALALRALGADAAPAAAATRLRALRTRVEATRALLTDPARTSVRLVTLPERLAVAETVRTAASLAVFGHHVDAVLVNRVLPDDLDDPYLAAWRTRQHGCVAEVRDRFAPVPVRIAPQLAAEPVGPTDLAGLADVLHGTDDPAARLHQGPGLEVVDDGPGHVLRLPLPHVARGEVALARRGDELHLRAGAAHRSIALPTRLRRCEVVGAGLVGEVLEVRFAPSASSEQPPAVPPVTSARS